MTQAANIFKQLCFHSTGHQGHYPGVNPQSDGAGSLLGQVRVAAHQQGRHGRKYHTHTHTYAHDTHTARHRQACKLQLQKK